VVAVALSWVVPPRSDRVDASQGPAWRAIAESLARARRTPGVPASIVAVVGLAASILTLVILVVPAFGHQRGWGPSRTGEVTAAWVAGGLLVTMLVARRGAFGRVVMCLGPLLGAAGAAVLAVGNAVPVAAAGVGMLGIGTTLTTTRLLPVFQDLTPPTMLARFQALMQLAQTGSTLVVLPLAGAVVSAAGPEAATAVLAAILLATTGPLLAVPG
jgi:hypothetical protein